MTPQDVRYPGQRSNGASFYYTSGALSLELTCSVTLNEDLKLVASRILWAGPIRLILIAVRTIFLFSFVAITNLYNFNMKKKYFTGYYL